MKTILEMAGYGGMSSDETETEATRTTVKVVRRREKAWRDPSLSRMWQVVEEYDCRKRREEKKVTPGNPGYNRLPCMETRPASNAAPVRGLPRNFYRSTWWLSQHNHIRDDLLAKPEKPLPDYTQCVVSRWISCKSFSPGFDCDVRLESQ
jgi:hypothetical protein